MEGPPNATPETIGMVPRAVSQLFFAIRSLAEKGWSFTMQAQYLEIYNESLRDLLSSTTSAVSTSTAFGSTTSSTSTTTTPTTEKLDIKHSRTGSITTVVGATVVDVSDATQVEKLLKLAASNRAVAATACNERSSRSHSVFTLRISGTNSNTQETRSSNLNLIDLAGSERLALSGATGDRLKETQAINKSLSCLGDVIAALGERGSGGGHIPYRNSKLTYLLMNSL